MIARGTALSLAALMIALGYSHSARAQSSLRLVGTELHVTTPSGERVVELGCSGQQARAAADRVFVACGDRGVVIVDLATDPARLLTVPQPSAAVGVFAGDGSVWARLADGSARPLVVDPSQTSEAPGVAAVAPPAEPPVVQAPAAEAPAWEVPPEPPRAVLEAEHAPIPSPPGASDFEVPGAADSAPTGRVIQVHADRAQVRLDGYVHPGTLVEFSTTPEVDVSLGRPRVHVVARGIVEAVRGRVARVQLETNSAVRVGMHARAAGRAGSLWLLPPMPGGVFQGSITLRTFLPIQTLALGVLMDLSVSYLLDLGDLGLRFAAELTNLGFALFAQQDPLGAVGHGLLSFATRWFELGAGIGASTLAVGWMADVQTGFSFAQVLRLGAEDGVSFRFRTNVVIGQNVWTGAQAWSFGDLYAEMLVPVGHGAWFIGRGGGGSSGMRYGEAAVRLRLAGNGRSGTVMLTVGGGFGWIDIALFQNAGPMVSIGTEFRP